MDWIKKRENQIFFSITLITIFIAISPLLTKYCLLGHDSDYHMLRIEALKQQIEMGKPFLKVNPAFFGGMGYASSLFYPDLLLFIPAILRVMGVSINNSYHIFMIVCIVLCFALTYVCGKNIAKNRYIGILFAVILTLSSYHMDDIFIRAAAGEYTAFIFVPVVLYGLYNLFFENMDKPWILGIGMGMVLLCHTLSFILCIVMIVIMLIFNVETFIKKPGLILKLMATALVTLIATISYWLPMVEQLMNTAFSVSSTWIEPVQEAKELTSIFSYVFPTLGIGILLLILPRVLLFRNHDDKVLKFADQCIILGIIFAFFASKLFPWNVVGKYFTQIQFPWRVYVIASVLLSFGAAVAVYRFTSSLCMGVSDTPKEHDNEKMVVHSETLINQYGLMLVIVLAVMAATCIYGFSSSAADREYFDFSNDYFSYKPYTANVIGGEWLPVSVTDSQSLVDMSDHALDASGNEVAFSRVKNTIVATIDNATEYVDVPFIYYKGYAAYDENGNALYTDGSGTNGLVRVNTQNVTGNITVYYKGTAIQTVSGIISVLAVLAIIAYIYRLYFYKKKDRETIAES